MEIHKGIEIIGNSLYLKKHKTLVISDLHLGFEESLNRQGVLVPRFQFKDILEQLEKIRKKIGCKIKATILNGDLKHEFGRITDQEWRELRKLFKHLQQNDENVIIVKGNHDVNLGPVAEMENVSIVKNIELEDIMIIHGDEIPKNLPKKIKTIIIGHEHPAVSLREGGRVERFKCFLKGKWKGKNLIVMPSFNPLIEGSDIMKEKTLSPFLQKNLSNFEVWVAADEPLYFGKVRNLK
ncbi:MAG: metallophosphoesterase [Nanoarchaeota archaeon]